ncbi:amidase [Streptomyces olivochromogenes]|uniref:amidase n=1 Tax=Streptomyces olivochromogenes TaxID=1963 RepID=UPI001F37DF79|nr:amidase [Streptomyces olivochromogenes]MCF3137269.1 amidase [Streptomyces olivochromogenes]
MVDVSTRLERQRAAADRLDERLGVFARRFDTPRAEGTEDGPLRDVTLGVKDVFATREAVPTAQSKVHDADWHRGRDAVAVRRLRAAGAVPLGLTTAAEHALGRPDPALPFAVPRNPWDTARYPGGSSSGSAAGLVHGLFDVGLGTDTGGSIRIPAALCGVTGIKPTHGLVPTAGCLPLAPSLDTVGTLARTVRDAARALGVAAGWDTPEPAWRTGLDGVRVGVPDRALEESGQLSPECREAFDTALERLRDQGAKVVSVELPELYPLFAAQLITLLAEGFDRHGAGLRARWDQYGRPLRRTLVLGGLIPASVYVHAQRVRSWGAAGLRARLDGLDALATPTWPAGAPRYDDPAGLAAVSWLPSLWSAVGFPAVALPMGFDTAGLPLSLQLAAAPGTDRALLAVADAYQQHTDWHLRAPAPLPATPPTPVVLPQGAASDTETQRLLGAALQRAGVPVPEAELAEFAGQWQLTEMLFGFLPELPEPAPEL